MPVVPPVSVPGTVQDAAGAVAQVVPPPAAIEPALPQAGITPTLPPVELPSLPDATPLITSVPLPEDLQVPAGIPLIAPSPTPSGAPPLLGPPNMKLTQAPDTIEGFPVAAAGVAGLLALLALQMRLTRKPRENDPE
ncbi:hypothetical protein GCM10010160_39690 [Acrocarpospora corrugata]